jgi:hypothetical protein
VTLLCSYDALMQIDLSWQKYKLDTDEPFEAEEKSREIFGSVRRVAWCNAVDGTCSLVRSFHGGSLVCCAVSCRVQIPVMVQSAYCHLRNRSDKSKRELGECPYDQVRSACCVLV